MPAEELGKYRDLETKEKVKRIILMVVENEMPGLAHQAKQSIVERLANEISGYGPLEELLNDENITEVIVERFDKVLVEKNGKLQLSNVKFDSEEHLRLVVERIIAPLGRSLNWATPTADGRLPDGSRVCAVIPPIAVDGTQLSIRKFKPNISMDQLVEWGALSKDLQKALKACVQARLNIVISGGTGSGKTTFLNALSEYIDPSLSIITIENPAEMQLRHPNVRRWEARPENIEGTGEISMMHLLITALRSRPDIILVGEVRGKEAYVLLQAQITGHDGSMTTLHANDTLEAMKRLVSMVASANELPRELVPDYVAGGVDLVIQLKRMSDGTRKLTEIAEVIGEENGRIITNPLVEFKVLGYEDGMVKGYWKATGNKFHLLDKLRSRGIEFPGWGS
ncbi:MAG: CpaF family protein [Thermosipho sp. (in: Bacteria)]|nr:CpaF family protein [Thermosipho sp. (in: thermotogales)]